jgi:hypothetical protein
MIRSPFAMLIVTELFVRSIVSDEDLPSTNAPKKGKRRSAFCKLSGKGKVSFIQRK